jgi:hypothetical protein
MSPVPSPPKENMDTLSLESMPKFIMDTADSSPCICDQSIFRICRHGIWDFFFRLFGLFPWQCPCARCQGLVVPQEVCGIDASSEGSRCLDCGGFVIACHREKKIDGDCAYPLEIGG